MIMDRLYEDVEKKGCVCVGLDTAVEYIPETLMKNFNDIEDSIFEFNKRIIDATNDIAGCFKVQIAYYEALGMKGIAAYKRTLDYIKNLGSVVIADIKRGDIAKTAEMYAKAHFEGDFESDIVTLSPYMGMDSIKPYLKYVEQKEKGLFVLVRTSNEGAKDIQYIEDQNGRRIYNHVAEKLQKVAENYIGNKGYSSVGAVIGCTHRSEAREMRQALGNIFFLIPGYGAQGGTAEDVAVYLKDGNGGIVNSSRGILLAYKNDGNDGIHFEDSSRKEVIRMKEEINNAVILCKKQSL